MKKINYIGLAKAAKAAAAECIASARRHDQGAHYVQRGVDVIAIGDDGERIEPVLDTLEVRQLSGKRLAQVVRDHAPAQYAYICVQGGIDAYDSFDVAMRWPDDYSPQVDCWDVDSDNLPSKDERIPLELCNARGDRAGLTVQQRIDANTIRQRGAAS